MCSHLLTSLLLLPLSLAGGWLAVTLLSTGLLGLALVSAFLWV
jgi:hypothetical protein